MKQILSALFLLLSVLTALSCLVFTLVKYIKWCWYA